MTRLDISRIAWLGALALALPGCPSRDKAQRELPPISKGEPVEPRTADGATVEYTLRFPAAHTNYLDVEAVLPATGDSVEAMMAVWTPGSYLVREYSRHIEELSAATVGGDPLAIDKTRKNRWRVTTGGADRVVLRYRLFARGMTVRTNYVDRDFAMLNGAPTFITLADDAVRAHDVALELPEGWSQSVTGLPRHPSGAEHRYLAPDFDTLVDSPIVAGNPAIYEFEIEGVPHLLANIGESHGDTRTWDGKRAAADVEAITRAHIEFWRTIPYSDYTYINVIHGRGGLEHKNSTLMLASPWAMRTRKGYIEWLGLVSHEFFHTWNIKRLRPLALGPFDYENENYTRSLWIVEGLTSYYDDLLVRRAGLTDRDEYLGTLSTQIESVQTTPGRKLQSLSRSSFDAWIKFYRPDENSRNTSVSYYRKGAVVGFLLDAEIRRVTRGQRSLDDAMRLAYERYAGERGYTPEQFRAVVDEVAGTSLAAFMTKAVDTGDELDYEPALLYFGLEFQPSSDDEDDETPGWLGVTMSSGGRVDAVLRGAPAYTAGINAGDELLAIDDFRVKGSSLGSRLAKYRPGDSVTVLVARRNRLLRIPVELGQEPNSNWKLRVAPGATRLQKNRLADWLAAPGR